MNTLLSAIFKFCIPSKNLFK